ncbi:MAG TPA: hypothetical protein VLR45_02805, partial [Desulfoprunum sp.]|nr:hypothetical protein [Desulfoprunum sp.]
MMRAGFVILVVTLGLTACSVGPDYRRPDLDLPATYRDAVAPAELPAVAALPWWQVYGDPTLKGLIATGLAGNLDVQLAAARVQEARAVLAGARSPALPSLSAGVTASPTARQ